VNHKLLVLAHRFMSVTRIRLPGSGCRTAAVVVAETAAVWYMLNHGLRRLSLVIDRCCAGVAQDCPHRWGHSCFCGFSTPSSKVEREAYAPAALHGRKWKGSPSHVFIIGSTHWVLCAVSPGRDASKVGQTFFEGELTDRSEQEQGTDESPVKAQMKPKPRHR
jgi:hypothetical protein